jgi:hypothetical protein
MNVEYAQVLKGTGAQVGDRGRERIRLGPVVRDAEFTVATAEPGRRISWRTGTGSPLHGELILELEPLDASTTRAVYGGSFGGHGLMRLFEPLVAGEVRAGVTSELERLKDAVERQAGAARSQATAATA